MFKMFLELVNRFNDKSYKYIVYLFLCGIFNRVNILF